MSLLFRITQSKVSTAINTIEFIPFVGDMIPVYTFSTILWIIRDGENAAHRKKVMFLIMMMVYFNHEHEKYELDLVTQQ